jgi:hypothetical protein
MKILLFSMMAAGALLAGTRPAAQAGTRPAEREWISQKDIAARGGYKLTVGKLGTFLIKRVRPADASASHPSCFVHIPSVRALIATGVSNGSLDFSTGARTIELKVTTCPKGLAAPQSEDSDPTPDPSSSPGTGGGGGGGGDDEDEEVCCKGGGKGCVADIERLP